MGSRLLQNSLSPAEVSFYSDHPSQQNFNPVNKVYNIITLLVYQQCSVVTGLLTVGEIQLQAE